jgi:hypothetical protein
MLWMTQPAWASTVWQIISHDYDTQSSYYGVKKACEPVHIQLDLSNYVVAVVNTTTAPLPGVSLAASVFSLDNKLLAHHEERKDAAVNSMTEGFPLDLAKFLSSSVVLVKLELHDVWDKLLSQNLYWLGADSAAYRALGRLPAADVAVTAVSAPQGDTVSVRVTLQNRGSVVAIQNKLTLVRAMEGSRILPAYYDDNYISLLPDESREIKIEYPTSAGKGPAQVALRGWNLASRTIAITESK